MGVECLYNTRILKHDVGIGCIGPCSKTTTMLIWKCNYSLFELIFCLTLIPPTWTIDIEHSMTTRRMDDFSF